MSRWISIFFLDRLIILAALTAAVAWAPVATCGGTRTDWLGDAKHSFDWIARVVQELK